MQVTIDHLTKRFGSTTAVNDLSLTMEDGTLTALLGPSGCGKSTILNMLSGILPVTEGKILFDGKDVTDLPPEKRNVGLVFQNYALYPHMTVLENICFPLEIKRVPKKQRIARALAKEPALLLLDEPLSNLDAKLRVEMREEILRIQRASRVTTVFVTHDQEEASSISDTVVLLKLGVLQQLGTARQLYDQPSNYFVADFLGAPPINKLRGTLEQGCFRFENTSLTCPVAPVKNVPDGTPVILALRAESVLVPAAGESRLMTTVKERYSIGKDELSVLEAGGQQLRAFIPGDYPLEPGQQLEIGFKKRGFFLFDAQTGERLQ